MKALHVCLKDYLELRRRLGFKLLGEASTLRDFVRFAEAESAPRITTALALRWATRPTGCQPARWAVRLSRLRLFARHVSAVDPHTQVPPPRLLPHCYRRTAPYLYRDQEVRRLIAAARQWPSPKHLDAATASTLFGLLAVTGLRVAEARGLARADVNLSQALLTVRQSKGQKTRWVPLHPSTQQALQRYARRRDRLCPHPVSPNFFVSARGTGLTRAIVRAWFQRAAQRSDLRTPPEGRRPRLHDLRHRFAIRTLLGWYRTKKDVEAHLPELATYLGHAHVASTYWYLTATPELLQAAMRCWQRHEGGRGR